MWKELQREPLNHKKKGQGEGEMDIIGLGKPVKDFLITLQKMPPEDQGTWLDDYSSQCGGKVATAIVAAARLGMQTAMCGVVGSDGKGDAIIEDFAYHNVDTTYVIREEEKQVHIVSALQKKNPKVDVSLCRQRNRGKL